ncbi:MAG: hypothetical protein WCK37_02135 [Candidatus Falkowbacteria bacterium]
MKNLIVKFTVRYDLLDAMVEKADVWPEDPLFGSSQDTSMSQYQMNYGFDFSLKKPLGLIEEYEGIVFLGKEGMSINEGIEKMNELGYEGANFFQFLGFRIENGPDKRYITGNTSPRLSDLAEYLVAPGITSIDPHGTSMSGLSMTKETELMLNEKAVFQPKTLFPVLQLSFEGRLMAFEANRDMRGGIALLGVKKI